MTDYCSIHLQLHEKPPENHRLWDHMVHQSSNATPPNQINLIKPLLNLVDGVMNVTQRLAMKLMTGHSKWDLVGDTAMSQ